MASKHHFNSWPVMRSRWISDVMAIFSTGLLNYSTALMNDGGEKRASFGIKTINGVHGRLRENV